MEVPLSIRRAALRRALGLEILHISLHIEELLEFAQDLYDSHN